MGFFSDIIKGIGKLFNAILEPLLGWLVPDPPAKEGLKVERQGSDQAIPVVYGTQQIGAVKVHKYVTDAPGGAVNEYLHLICVFCEGEVDAIEEIFFNGISENDEQWNKDGGGDWFRIKRYTGTASQAADSDAVAEIPNWTANHKLSGLCYAYIRLEIDENQSIWRGEPQITARIRGRKLFDPRDSSTAYSENPALAIRDYLTNPIYGKGLSTDRLDDSTFIAVANACDAGVTNTVTRTVYTPEIDPETGRTINTVTTTTTTETKALFTCNIFLDTGQSIFDNLKELLGTFRGIMPLSAGTIKLSFETSGDPVFNFNDDNIVGSIDVDSGSINDRFNRVEVRFPNKEKDYEKDSVFYPPEDDPIAATWLAEDNGVRLEQSFDFSGITSKDEALQMAQVIANKSRFTLTVGLESQPIGIKVEAGDIVSLTNATHGWIEKPFRVIEKTIKEDDTVDFALTEHEDAVYPWSGATFDELTGGTFLADPTKLAPVTNLALALDSTLAETGTLSWDYEQDGFVKRYDIVIQAGGETVASGQSFGRSFVVPLLSSGTYTASVYALSTTGFRSPAATVGFTLQAPTAPTSITLIERDWEIEAQPQLAGIGLGTTFEFDVVQGDGLGHTPTSIARGASYTATGLLPNTQYTIFARTINAFGESEWVSATGTTTNTGNQAQPFIDQLETQINADLEILNRDLVTVDEVLEQVSQDVQEVYERADVEVQVREVRADLVDTVIAEVDSYLDELNGETLPELNARLTVAEGEIDTLETVTIPAVNARLDDAESDITTLNATTIPQIQSELAIVEFQIDELSGVTSPLSGQVPNTIDNVLEEMSQDIQEVIQRSTGQRELGDLFPIESTSILDDAIITPKLAANAVIADKIAANAVTADKILANSITAAKIAAGAVEADKIAANAVTANKIAALAVTADKIAANTITGDKIVGNTITAANIASLTITGDEIAANAISAGKIVAGAVTTEKMTANSINGDRIAANTLNADKIVSNSITAGQIASRSIIAANIEARAITSFEIAANTIEAENIKAGTLTANEIASRTILAANIKAGEITANEIAANTITGDKIVGRSIGADKLVANDITANEIASRTIQAINIATGTLTANEIQTGSLTAETLDAEAIYGKRSVVTAGNISVVTDPGTTELTSDLVMWVGDSSNTTAASRGRNNALFFIGADGTVSSNISGGRTSGQLTAVSNSGGASVGTTRSFTLKSNRGLVELTGVTGWVNITSGLSFSGTIGQLSMEFRIRNVTTNTVLATKRIPMTFNSSFGSAFTNEQNVPFFGEDDLSSSDYGDSFVYQIEMEPTWTGAGSITGSWFTSNAAQITDPKIKAYQFVVTF